MTVVNQDCMQLIRDIYRTKATAREPVISFEFFPPKTEEGEQNFLQKTVPALAALKPDFCSVTYGAGGSTRAKTLMIVDRIQRDHGLTALAHLTCVGSSREELGAIADQAHGLGIRNILALRGDPSTGEAGFVRHEHGFEFAWQLVQFLRGRNDFCLGVAGFPEGHIECREGKQIDWQRLKAKIDQGADFVLSQLFFDNRHFFEFRDALTTLGVNVPVVPGIIPILSATQIKKFTALCGAELPAALRRELDRVGDDPEATIQFGIEYATRQCEELLHAGVPGLHFYTLNRARPTTAILNNLGLATPAPTVLPCNQRPI
jgi:methylenetetrahydrofolate reductase (NADPH)